MKYSIMMNSSLVTQMLIELSTYATIILTAENDNGFSVCDKIFILS